MISACRRRPRRVQIRVQKPVQARALLRLLLQTLRSPQIIIVIVYDLYLSVGLRLFVHERVARHFCVLACVDGGLVHEAAVGVEDVVVYFVFGSRDLELLGVLVLEVVGVLVLGEFFEEGDFFAIVGGVGRLEDVCFFVLLFVHFALS